MNADEVVRELRFQKSAVEDLKALRLKPSDFRKLVTRLKEIAALADVCSDDDVCRIAQTRGEWMRLSLKYLRPSTRVIFSIEEEGDVLLIRAVLKRTARTYDLAEDLWRLARVA